MPILFDPLFDLATSSLQLLRGYSPLHAGIAFPVLVTVKLETKEDEALPFAQLFCKRP